MPVVECGLLCLDGHPLDVLGVGDAVDGASWFALGVTQTRWLGSLAARHITSDRLLAAVEITAPAGR